MLSSEKKFQNYRRILRFLIPSLYAALYKYGWGSQGFAAPNKGPGSQQAAQKHQELSCDRLSPPTPTTTITGGGMNCRDHLSTPPPQPQGGNPLGGGAWVGATHRYRGGGGWGGGQDPCNLHKELTTDDNLLPDRLQIFGYDAVDFPFQLFNHFRAGEHVLCVNRILPSTPRRPVWHWFNGGSVNVYTEKTIYTS